MNSREAFIKFKPTFTVEVRGNAVNDAAVFTSKNGNTFTKFKIAYSPAKDAPSVFFDVLFQDGGVVHPGKGDFVGVVGDYRESENVSDKDGLTYLNRTIFATSVEVLGAQVAKTVKKAK